MVAPSDLELVVMSIHSIFNAGGDDGPHNHLPDWEDNDTMNIIESTPRVAAGGEDPVERE